MTEKEFLDARDLVAAAVARAVKILGYVSGGDETAKVDLYDDGSAGLSSWRGTGDYDGCRYLEEEVQSFPAHLLFCTEEEVDAWLAEKKRAEEATEARMRAQRAAASLANEMAVYAALKQKYG